MSYRSPVPLDKEDPLAKYKKEFFLLKDTIYLDGNSLGLMSKKSEQSTLEMLSSWKKLGIEGWTSGDEPWFYFAEKLGDKMAPLVGAKKGEVICTGSTTTDLHQLLASFYAPKGKRVKILADELTFPSDIYAIKSHMVLRGQDPEKDLVLVKSRDGQTLLDEDIIAAFTDEIALAILPVVLYRSGQLLNMNKLTKAAHKKGVLIGFDGCHSVGAVAHNFHDDDVDFAFWCTYKYLNGGPGSVGAIFVHQKHLGRKPGLAGWFSSDKRKQFDMSLNLTAAPDAGAFQIGTPHIMSMAALLGSLELFEEVGMEKLRQKSLKLTTYLIELVKSELTDLGVEVITPLEENWRGGHVGVTHEDAIPISQSLRKHGVIPDFRQPNIIRLAPIAFYTSFADVERAVQILKTIISNKEYLKAPKERSIVS